MSDRLSSIHSIAINEGFAQNFLAYFKHLASPEHEANQIELKQIDTSSLLNVGLSLPIFNGIYFREDSDLAKVFDDFDPFYNENQIPYQLWLDSELKRADYDESLIERGFRYIGDENGLVIDIEKMDKNVSYPNSLYVEAINSQERFSKYVDVVKLRFNYRGNSYQEYIDKFAKVDFKNKPQYWRKYIGWLNGEPVGTATLILAGGMAMIYEEALTTQIARRPYGTHDGITLKLMQDALKLGFTVGGVLSSVGELRRYFALGFEEKLKIPKYVRTFDRRARRR